MLDRRHAFQALLLGGLGVSASAAGDSPLTLADLRGAATLAGLDIGDDRLRQLLPILESRRRQFRELRAIPVDDNAGLDLPAAL